MVGMYVTGRINEETSVLAAKYEKAQKQREQQYGEQFAALNKKLQDVEANSKRAAEEAGRAAAASVQQQSANKGALFGGKPQEPGQPLKKSSLALKTPPGKRAVTVNIESLGAVGGLINPGDFVDIIAQLDVPLKGRSKDKKENVTAMIFQKLQILAINTNLDQPGAYDEQQKESTLKVTFAVNPQEAGLLAFANKNGKLQLALRGTNENKSVMLSTATWSTLAEYVLENNGADLHVADEKVDEEAPSKANVETQDVQEVKPYIQIFRGGKEL
jgi:pilus assembly protein CpaB